MTARRAIERAARAALEEFRTELVTGATDLALEAAAEADRQIRGIPKRAAESVLSEALSLFEPPKRRRRRRRKSEPTP
jgi:hypothetical protein